MRLSKKEVISFGKIQSLSKMALIAINEKLSIEHINAYAKKLLGIIGDNNLIGKSIIEVIKLLHIPPLINDEGEIIATGLFLINDHFQKWEKSTANVENEKWSLLIGHNIGPQKKIYQTFLTAFKDNKTILNKDKLYLNSIIENLPELVYWKDNNCIYQGGNKRVAELLNLSTPSEMIGKSDYDFGWSKKRVKSLRQVDLSIIQKGISSIVEDEIPVNGIIKTHITSKTPLRDQTGKIIGILGISTDISERKKMEKDLKLAKEAAEASAQSKAAFIANMSHDLRTPLSGIIGLSTMLEDRAHNADEKQNAHWIHDSGEQLLVLLNGILDVVAAENLGEDDIHNESFDLRKCIEGIVQLELPTTKSKNLDLRVKVDNKIPVYIISDRMKLHRIILNLLGNAIKFTKTGSITIEVTSLDNTAADVHLQFDVADTGIGIPLELQDKVFDRFYRVTPSYKGTYEGHGIGLHIAQTYVALLGGHITLTSQEGVGTTFHFDLPCKIGNKKDAVPQKTTIPAPKKLALQSNKPPAPIVNTITNKTKTTNANAPYILLVEDNPIALNILESLIEETGCLFESAVDGKQALALATTHKFNLILTDIGLPDISGHEFTKQFRKWEKKHRKKPILVVGLSAHARDNAIKECLQCGMDDVYTKPATLALIRGILKAYHLQDKGIKSQSPKFQDETSIPATSGKFGKDLPDTEDELFAIDAFLLFSPQAAFKYIKDITMLLKQLKMFLSGDMQKDVHKMTMAYEKKDWGTVERLAHKIKSGLGYIGLLRMGYACQYLERYHKAGHRDLNLLDKLYHQVIKTNKESIKEVKSWMKKLGLK
jgi:two-component system aerobic respiration control sensor histidine kinase ArcB